MAALMPRPSGKECTEMDLKHLLYSSMQKRCIRMNIYDVMHGWIKISDAAKCRICLKNFAGGLQSASQAGFLVTLRCRFVPSESIYSVDL